MRVASCGAWSIWLLISFIAPAFAADAEVVPRGEVDRFVAPAIQGQWVQSMVIGVLGADGTRQFFGYGILSPANHQTPTRDSLYEIGSITKTFTGTLLAQMVERHEMALNDPVQKYLPESVKVPRTKASAITLLHLATHRSGLPRLPMNFEPKDWGNPYADYTVGWMYEFLSSYQLPRDPGEAPLYSNLGMGLLGHALARRAGMSYEALLIQRICDPLKMDSTRITLDDALRARLAAGCNADGEPQKNWDLGAMEGAGAIRSSADDMLKYLAAEAGQTHTAFDAALKLTQTRQATFEASRHIDIGLNWLINTTDGVRWHNGQTGGYTAFAGFQPDRHVAVVVLSTTSAANNDIGMRLLHRLLGKPMAPLQLWHSIAIAPAELEKYVGRYKLGLLSTLTIRLEKDHLTAQVTAQPAVRIYPESKTTFFWKLVDANVTFDIDAAGKVTGLVLHQNGANLPAKRID